MSSETFEARLPFILRWEGGFVDHPADPGGRTNRGVTQRTYDAWRKQQGLTPRDVKDIEESEVHRIYEANYWRTAGCDSLREGLDLAQFDTAVNMGVQRAVRFLQQALGCGVDGKFGSGTAAAAAQCPDVGAAIIAYCDARENYYNRLAQNKPELKVFLKGWMNRLNALRKEVGLPGYESVADGLDFGDAGYVARIPDLGEDSAYDF